LNVNIVNIAELTHFAGERRTSCRTRQRKSHWSCL